MVGFAGNELVARYRIRTGRKIGSAALVADGLHARTDGFTSLAVLLGAGGVALGWDGPTRSSACSSPWRSWPCCEAAREVCRRLMDAVDPALVDRAERPRAAPGCWHRPGPDALDRPQMRAEGDVVVAADLSRAGSPGHGDAEHALLHAIPRLAAALVHADPDSATADPHLVLADHRHITAA